MTTRQAAHNRNPFFGVNHRQPCHSLLTRNSLVVALITFILLAPLALAQSTAMLSGVVKDSSGAMITGANITVTNQLTSEHRAVVTNSEGYFSLPGLLVGTYTLKAESKGFVSYAAKDILLNASDSKTVNITLSPGAAAETVEVSAVGSAVAVVDSGEKSSVLTSADLTNATLASRNAAEIVRVLGGATMTANGGKNTPNTTSTIGINGYTVGGNAAGLGGTQVNGQTLDITLDGGHVFDPGAAGSATPVNPNMDMISEVKVLASNFSAEYEKGPVVINAETKGGGSQYHGQVHLVAQNYNLNGTDMSVRQSHQKKGASSAYYPGAQLGGPIPFGSYNRNHDKLFFFEGFEAYRQTVDGLLARAFVPTNNMIAGNFSPAEMAPFGQSPWPENQVPTYPSGWQPWLGARPNCTITGGVLSAGCIDPNGQKILAAYFPRPNADPATNQGFNYVGQVLSDQNSWQNITREDWNISSNTKVFVRYSAQREVSNQPLGLWGNSGADSVVPAPTNDIGDYKSDSYSASLMHVFTPTMISETTFAYTFEGMPNRPADFSKVSRAGLGLTITGVYGNLQAPAFTAWGPAMPNIGSGANLGADYSPTPGVRSSPGMMANKGMPSVRENFSKVINAHTLKVGAYWEHIYNKQDNWGTYTGVFQTPQGWGTGVGNNYADILMGIDAGQYDEQQLPPPTQISQNLYEFYVNDHWKVTRRLTVDVGMRFDHFGKPYSENNLGLAIFDASKYNNSDDATHTIRDAHTGVLWHGIDHSIPLSGAKSRLFFYSPRFGAAWDVFGNAKTIVRGGFGFFRAYDSLQSNAYTGPAQTAMGAGSFHCDAWSCPTFEDIDAQAVNHPLPAGLPKGLLGVNVVDPKNNQQPLLKTYSLSVDQQLPGKFIFELSYVGNKGSDQQSPVDMNSVPLGTIPLSYLVACNQPNQSCNYDTFRPRTNYKAITESITLGTSQFDSMQVSLHRSYGWLNVLANYTWSKAFVNGLANNSCCQSGGFPDRGASEYWGIAPNNRPQAFNISYTINLPKVRSGNAFLRGAGSGWQIGGITTIQSGANETAQSYFLNYGQDDNAGAGIFNSAVGRLGSPQITMMPTISCDPRMNQEFTLPDGSVVRRYLNPACFSAAAPGTAGTTHMPYLPGPMFWNSDISLTKNFNVTERQRVSFKVQAFNFLNHGLWSFNPNDPNLQIKYNADGTQKLATMNGVTYNNFGLATRQFGHRTIELSARYEF